METTPFNPKGMLRPAEELEAIASNLEPGQRALWDDLVVTARECELAEARAKACNDATADAVRKRADIAAALPRYDESTAFHALWLATVKNHQAEVPDQRIDDLQAADRRIELCRREARSVGDQVRAGRTKLATALSAFVNGGPKWTALDQARDFQRTSQLERQARAEGRAPPRRPNAVGPSVVDRTAAAYSGGGYGMRRGGGRSYARGAYSQAQASDLNAQRTRAAAAAAKVTQ